MHTHSNYSLREGAARVSDLAGTAAEMGMEALALTDHDGMYGAVRFTLACKKVGIRPILGAELEWGDGYHVTLLAQNVKGWSNLCYLVTNMHLACGGGANFRLPPGIRPRTSFADIAEHSEGLFCLSGCARGEVPWLVGLGQMDPAGQAIARWLDVFGTDRFAIEIHNHLLEQDPLRMQRLTGLAKSFGLRTAAANNVHYVRPHDAALHDVLDCIRRIVALTPQTSPRQNREYWLKPPKLMAELHDPEAIAGAEWIAGQCSYELPLGKFHFPDPGVESGRSSTELLAKRCWSGLKRRYLPVTREIEDRLQMELRMIRRGGFCGYFLLVADIVDHCKHKLGIRCACRGSAAGSLAAYALGISDVDPVRHDLVFERFMNEHRREIPDIDIDIESARREEVNEYILATYGKRTAMVAMMETFQAKAALRETGKALGIAESEIDTISKSLPHIAARNISGAIESLPEVAGLNLKASKLETLFELAGRLDSFPRHLAMHPSGVILSDETLGDIMPMQRSFKGFLMSQFDKNDVEALGIAKLDVLGVRMFSSIAYTLNEIERTKGYRPDLSITSRKGSPRRLSSKDPATFQLIRESRTLGCFQIESPGQRELLGKFQPDKFEELIIDISLFRPGPMKADMVKPFLSRRMALAPTIYGHPKLAPILKETNGVVVYHEQVMRVLSALTGCSLGEADKIRRCLNDLSDHESIKQNLVARAVELGWDKVAATKVCDDVLAFASFGFCKAHAAAFAVPTYQSAWLKAHHPVEFYCGILTHDPGMYPRRAILSDARAWGVPILPLDVNASWTDYRSEEGGIRIGLQDVKGITGAEIEVIISGRPWRSPEAFCREAAVSRPVIESLIHCGAFDSIKGKRSRRQLFWMSTLEKREPQTGEQMAFQEEILSPEQIVLPGIEEYSDRDRVSAELEVTGLDSTRHVISFYIERLNKLGWTPASELLTKRGGATVVVAGVKVATQTPPIRSGKRVIFLTLDDGTGQPNIALFDEAQAKFARVVFDGWILAVKGKVRRTGAKGISILGEEVIDLATSIN
ncbi:MAG: DNA polymerase III subunit alpha [Actinomycetota bacterium]